MVLSESVKKVGRPGHKYAKLDACGTCIAWALISWGSIWNVRLVSKTVSGGGQGDSGEWEWELTDVVDSPLQGLVSEKNLDKVRREN